jgi:hypothetical protein
MNPEASDPPKVLLVTDVIFWNRGRGSAERIQTMFEHLKTYCRVVVCFVSELSIEDWNHAATRLDCELIGPGKPGKLASLVVGQASRLKSKSTDFPRTQESQQQVTLADFRSEVISDFVYRYVEQHQPDVVLLQYVTMGYLCERLRGLDDTPLLLIDTHDVMHLRRLAFKSKDLSHWLRIDCEEEVAVLKHADVVLAIQEQEAKTLGRLLPEKKVCLVKHAVTAAKNAGKLRSANEDFVLGFVASRGTANLNSLDEFLKFCWPKIRKKCRQEIRLIIGGNISAADLNADDRGATESCLDGVEFAGRFDNTAEFYQQIDLAINPAQIASGMKVKSLQALAHSVPLISTPAGIAGMESAIGICALVADDWQQFADHVYHLFSDQIRLDKMSEICVSFLAEEFDPEVVFAELKQAILEKR